MTGKAKHTFENRNPDVLTSIANLSNDEVFTPPAFANIMIDTIEKEWAEQHGGANIWQEPNVKFLDPFTKSGVFLREITRRLVEGLEKEIPDLQQRVDHILTKQIFGVAITRLTALLSRRSVYCSKVANSNHSICTEFSSPDGNIRFSRTEHHWVGGRERLIKTKDDGEEFEIAVGGKCKFCRASQDSYERGFESETHAYSLIHTEDATSWIIETFGEEMQFDVIVGNPPYQLDDGGFGTSAGPIYNLFVEQAIALNPRFICMVIPARWSTGGKGLDKFRKHMLGDDRLQVIHDYPNSSKIFPGVQIKNGVCYFLWNQHGSGPCEITNHFEDYSYGPDERPLLEPGADVLIRYNPAVAIVRKVMASEAGSDKSPTELCLPTEKRFSTLVSSRRPFGFDTTFAGNSAQKNGDLKVYRNKGVGYIPRDEVTEGTGLIDCWKVFTPRASSGSDSFPHPVLGAPFIGEPSSISSETYLAIGPFMSEEEAENVISYLKTRFARFMALQKKSSQDATRSIYDFVPVQDFSRPWNDEDLYAKYHLVEDEVAFIKKMIRPMGLEDG